MATKLTTRVDQIIAELNQAKSEFAKSPTARYGGKRDNAKAIGHLRTAQAMTRRVKDFVQTKVVDEKRGN